MPSVGSYFVPWSSEQHGLNNFAHLKGGQKALTVILTAVATIVSLPILGLGGVVAFRLLSERFSVINLKNLDDTLRTPVILTAEKVHDSSSPLLGIHKMYGENFEVMDFSDPGIPLNMQKDSIFSIISEELRTTPSAIVTNMQNYIENNLNEIEELYNESAFNKEIPLNSFKKLLVDSNTRQALVQKGKKGTNLVYLQQKLTTARAILLSRIYSVKIVVYNTGIRKMKTVTCGEGDSTLTIVQGMHTEYDDINIPKPFFIQPRLLKNKS